MQPSFFKQDHNDTTRLTNNFTRRVEGGGNNHADLSVLINDSTSMKARGVINKLNRDQQRHQDLLSISQREETGHFLSRDDTANRSTALIRGAHNVLGLSEDNFHKQEISEMSRNRGHDSMANISTAQFGQPNTSRLGSASTSGNLSHQKNLETKKLPPNPNLLVRNQGLGSSDRKEVDAHWSKLEQKEKAEKFKAYVDSLVDRVEKLESHAKDFKQYDKATLDAKDEEIRQWVITQKKVDEERRVEIENKLRTIFQDKIIESTGYSPSEGFLLSIDFM